MPVDAILQPAGTPPAGDDHEMNEDSLDDTSSQLENIPHPKSPSEPVINALGVENLPVRPNLSATMRTPSHYQSTLMRTDDNTVRINKTSGINTRRRGNKRKQEDSVSTGLSRSTVQPSRPPPVK